MFLLLLLIFPFLAYFLYKNSTYKNVSGNIKLIFLLGLFLIFTTAFSNLFDRKETYLVFMIFWYIFVFIYFYSKHIILLKKNISFIRPIKGNITNGVLKFIYLFLVFIFFISVLDSYSFYRNFNDIFMVNYFLYFIGLILVFGAIYEVIDSIKNYFIKKIIINKKEKIILKKQIKQEILKELNENQKVEV